MDILILALIAVFLLAKLFSVLGSDDHGSSINRDQQSRQNPSQQGPSNGVVSVDFKNKTAEIKPQPAPKPTFTEPDISDENVRQQIQTIQKKDQHFTAGSFLNGASIAYEMVVQAFNQADKNTLKNMLSSTVYDLFNKEIDSAIEKGSYPETTIVSMKESTIEKIEIVRNKAQIFVKFVAEEVNVLKDKEGNIIEGDPAAIQEISDQWVFERDLRSTDPNWTIVET